MESGRRAEKGKLEGHDDAVWAVAWSKDGASLATAGADRKVHVRDAAGKEQFVLEGHKDWISGLAFSPDRASWPAAASTAPSNCGM